MGIVARQSIKGTIATYIGVAVGIVTTFFIQTKALQPEQIGLIDVLLQCALLFSGLAQLGTNSSAMRYYPFFKDEKHRDHGFFGWTLLVPLIGFTIFLMAFFTFKPLIVRFFSKDSGMFGEYVNFVIPLAFFMLYISVFETNSNLLLRIVLPKFIREVGLRVGTLAIYLLYFYKVIDFDGVVVSFCVLYGLATLINVVYLLTLKRVSFKIERNYIDPKLSSLGAISQPHISQAMAKQDTETANVLCKNVALHQFMVGSFVFFLVWINIDFLFDLLPNGDIYRLGKWAVLILSLGRLIYSSFGVAITVISYSKYYYYSLIFTILLATVSVLMNRWLVPILDINGAALAGVLSYFVYYVLLLTFIKCKIGVMPFSRKLLPVAAIVLALFGLNWLWTIMLTPWFANLFEKSIFGLAIDAALKSAVFLILGLAVLYKMKVSASVNDLVDRVKGLRKHL